MKKVVVNENQVALVLKRGKFLKLLNAGTYWFFAKEDVAVYDQSQLFNAPVSLNYLLQFDEVRAALDVIEVGENEIALEYKDNQYSNVWLAGKYTFWKGLDNSEFKKYDTSEISIAKELKEDFLTKKLATYIRTYTVESYEKGLLFINGNFEKILDSGTYYWWRNATTIQVAKADMRQQELEISGQEILTKDKAALRINFFVLFKVSDIKMAIFSNKEYQKQLYTLLQLSLRELVGAVTLDELLDAKQKVSDAVISTVAEQAKNLGVEINSAGIRDIILNGDMKTIMNKVLIAEKQAQANTIMRREETASMRTLLNTAKLMEENEMLWKLKEMEYVEKVAEKVSNISISGNGQVIDQLKQLFVKS